MSAIEKAMAHLQVLRHKFDGLLGAARINSPPHGDSSPQPLQELVGFGSNPGNLRMFMHVPMGLPRQGPLVVALHGCSQSAEEYGRGTGWSALADRLGFAVLYPGQQTANNPNNCFSWFLPGDIARDRGEALSIRQMIAHAIATFGLDGSRVFVTGLSAGGAMASVMLATYPEVFAGGAIIAGLSYGCARSAQQAFEAMFQEQTRTADALGDRVRAASPHRGPWPTISVWHGTADPVVKPSNGEDIVRQWVNVHGLDAVPAYEESIGRHARRIWTDADGNTRIEAFSIAGMAHGVPLASMPGDESYGVTGAFFLEAGISSTHRIADSWHLGDATASMPRAAAVAAEQRQIPAGSGSLVLAGATSGGVDDVQGIPSDASAAPSAASLFGPSAAIAAAFKAAGLAPPEFPSERPGIPPQVAPGPIIATALKAAGLTRT